MKLFCHLWNQTKTFTQATPKIVLLHGMGGTGALWRPIAASLEEKMAVLAPDQRGHGKSLLSPTPEIEDPLHFTPLSYGQDVAETLRALHFHPTWILGHSMGVRTAVATAHLMPNEIQGLILVDLGFAGSAGGGLGITLAHFLKILPEKFPSRKEAKDFMHSHCPDPSIARYLLAVSTLHSDGQITFPFDHSALIQTIEEAEDFSLRDWLRDLGSKEIPILTLRGKKSLVWSKEQFDGERETFSKQKTFFFKEVDEAGHGLPFEQRNTFLSIIQEFMNHYI